MQSIKPQTLYRINKYSFEISRISSVNQLFNLKIHLIRITSMQRKNFHYWLRSGQTLQLSAIFYSVECRHMQRMLSGMLRDPAVFFRTCGNGKPCTARSSLRECKATTGRHEEAILLRGKVWLITALDTETTNISKITCLGPMFTFSL